MFTFAHSLNDTENMERSFPQDGGLMGPISGVCSSVQGIHQTELKAISRQVYEPCVVF